MTVLKGLIIKCTNVLHSGLAAVDEETIACGALVRCRLDPAADKDSFKFMAAAGNAVDIRVTEAAEVAGCTGWTLFAPNGKPIDDNFFFCEQSKSVSSLPGSGNYTILVSNDANAVVDYKVLVTLVGP